MKTATVLANAARYFTLNPDVVVKFADNPDIAGYLKKNKTKADSLTPEIQREAARIIRQDTAARHERYARENAEPGCKLVTVVRGDSLLDPMLNPEHPHAARYNKPEPVAYKSSESEEPSPDGEIVAPKPKKEKKAKGPGIIQTLITLLQAASKKRPQTKDSLLAELQKLFPDRPAPGMSHTIKCQLGYGLKGRGYTVKSKDDGFWIED